MSEPDANQRDAMRSRTTINSWSFAVLVFLSAANIFLLLFIVPKFEQIFADALPGMPLPGVTEFIISSRIALAFIALGWPIMGIILIKLQKPHAILWMGIGATLTFVQIGITVIALFMPMISTITGTSDKTAQNLPALRAPA